MVGASRKTQYTDKPVCQGTTYRYRVQSCGVGGCSNFSDEVVATTPAPQVNLRVTGAHMNQVVQTFGGDVPLVASRPGLLRVFVEAEEANGLGPDVEIRLYHDSAHVHTETIPAPRCGIPTSNHEALSTHVWAWPIPRSLVTPDLGLTVTIDPDGKILAGSPEDNDHHSLSQSESLDVREVPPLDLRIVPIHHDSTGLTGGHFSGLIDDAFAMLPIAELNEAVNRVYTTTLPPLKSDNSNRAWTELLSEINALRVAEGTGEHYYGLVRTTYPAGVAGMGYVGSPTAIGWDREPSASGVFAHELGHNFGRRHAPCPSHISSLDSSFPYPEGVIGQVGLDDGTLLDPETKRDIMSYCRPRWISDYTYEGILDFRGTAPGSPQAASSPPRQASLVLWGVIGPDWATLRPAFEAETRPSLPESAGPYSIEGTDAHGRVLFSHAFEGVETGKEDGTRSFAFAIPLTTFSSDDLVDIRLRKGASTMERRTRSAIPDMALLELRSRREVDGRTLIEWDAEQAPLLVVRHPISNRILSLAQGGQVRLPSWDAQGELDLTLSDGVRSQRNGAALR